MSEANFLKSLTEMDVDGITAKQTATVKGKILLYHQLLNDGLKIRQCSVAST